MRPLLSVGLQFFTIQLAVLVIFTSDKMLITQLLGPQFVTQYEIVFKLFSVVTIAHALVTAPLWSAYTEAYHKGDFPWIRHMFRKQLVVYIGAILTSIILGLLAKPIIAIWVGPEVVVSYSLIVAIGVFVLISMWNNTYAMFVNGIGDIKTQLYTAIVAMFLNIPLSIFLVKYLGFGLSGIVMATIFSLLFAAIALPIQVRRILCIGVRNVPL
jgi:O-antigen/teichoic acid export membrane protein